jgi:hypothetical protein
VTAFRYRADFLRSLSVINAFENSVIDTPDLKDSTLPEEVVQICTAAARFWPNSAAHA